MGSSGHDIAGRNAVREAVWRVGEGRTSLQIRAQDTGDGVVVTVTGDLGPHVGAVACAPPLSVTTFQGHRDGELSGPIAARLAGLMHRPVVVVAGVHVDDITREEIDGVLCLVPAIVEDVWEWFSADGI